jgi:hypothetical protein
LQGSAGFFFLAKEHFSLALKDKRPTRELGGQQLQFPHLSKLRADVKELVLSDLFNI